MADKYNVQMGEEDYRIVGPNGEEGPMVPYGTLATLSEPGENAGDPPSVYFCLVTDPDDESPKVWCVDSVSEMVVEAEEVEFPPAIVKAQRALDEALEDQEKTIEGESEAS